MGLLGGNLDEETKQALFAMASGLLMGSPNGRKNFGADLGHAGLLGMQAYSGAKSQQAKLAEEAQQKEMRAMQMDAMRRQAKEAQDTSALAARAFAPPTSQAPDPYEFDQMGEGTPMPQTVNRPGGGGLAEYQRGLFGINPKEAIALQVAMQKDSPYAKLDPKDYTPESIKAFAASGGRDFTVLQPRVKMEAVNAGGTTQFVNPYQPGGPIPHSLSPADQQRIPIERAGLGVQIAKARDEGVGGLPGIPGFMTGGAPGLLPVSTPTGRQVVPATQPPQTAPQATAPGMSPKQQREMAETNAKSLPTDLKAFQAASGNLDALSGVARELRDHPGLAGITGGMGAFPNAPGSNASGAAAKLTTLKAKAAFTELQAMRASSPTGGALGAVSDKEMGYLENSIAALDTKQNTKEFKAALAKVETYSNMIKKRMETALRQRYGDDVFKQQQGADPLGIR